MPPVFSLLLCLVLLAGLPCAGSAAPIPIDARTSHISLAGLTYASPAGVPLNTPEEALALYRRGGFERLLGHLGRGYRKDDVWLAFDLQASPDAPQILIAEIAPAYLDEVRAYQVDGEGKVTYLGRAGDQVPWSETNLRSLRPAFALRPSQGSTILLRIHTSSTQAAIITLHAGALYPALQSAQGLIFGAIAALNLTMALGALTLFVLFRDRAYLLWMVYVLLTCAQWLSLDGLLYLYYPWENLNNLNRTINILSVVLFAVGALLMTTLFQFRQIHPWIHRFFVGWAAAMVLPLLTVPFGGAWIIGLLGQLSAPAYPLAMLCILIQVLRGHRVSRLHGPMFFVHIGASLLNILAITGYYPFSETTLYGWQLTSFLNLLSLQVGMFIRMRDSLQEHERHRLKLIEALNDKNVELEQQVTQRTASLAQALRNVQQAESEQRQLLSMASHEFRTPAAVIKSSLDSLRFVADLIPPEVAQRLNNIEHACSRLTHLSNTLIHQDRLQELALHPKAVPVDVAALMHEVLARYPTASADSATPQVALQGRPTAPLILADPALVSIALHNLIDNALQHGRRSDGLQPAPIEVSLAVLADSIELRVADRGPGIPDEEKTRIFERFHALASPPPSARPSPTRTQGDGLGLSIVHAIALAHGGRSYAADHPGGGAVLILNLPKNPPPRTRIRHLQGHSDSTLELTPEGLLLITMAKPPTANWSLPKSQHVISSRPRPR